MFFSVLNAVFIVSQFCHAGFESSHRFTEKFYKKGPPAKYFRKYEGDVKMFHISNSIGSGHSLLSNVQIQDGKLTAKNLGHGGGSVSYSLRDATITEIPRTSWKALLPNLLKPTIHRGAQIFDIKGRSFFGDIEGIDSATVILSSYDGPLRKFDFDEIDWSRSTFYTADRFNSKGVIT